MDQELRTFTFSAFTNWSESATTDMDEVIDTLNIGFCEELCAH